MTTLNKNSNALLVARKFRHATVPAFRTEYRILYTAYCILSLGSAGFFGGQYRGRTCDIHLVRVALCQLS